MKTAAPPQTVTSLCPSPTLELCTFSVCPQCIFKVQLPLPRDPQLPAISPWRQQDRDPQTPAEPRWRQQDSTNTPAIALNCNPTGGSPSYGPWTAAAPPSEPTAPPWCTSSTSQRSSRRASSWRCVLAAHRLHVGGLRQGEAAPAMRALVE